MKLIEIINKRCNCKVSQVVVKSQIEERTVFKDINADNIGEYNISHRIGNVELLIKYSAPEQLSNEAVHLLTDFVEIYMENRASWEIAESVSKSPDIYVGRKTLDEMVEVVSNALINSGLFDKAAVMFFNEKLMELRGIYVAGSPVYTKEQVKLFKNKRVHVKKSIIEQLRECYKNPDDMERHVELEDKIFRSIDNTKLSNRLIIAPMMAGSRVYGVLITYSDHEYSNTHIFTARFTARLLNTMMMAVISNRRYDYATSFYKKIEMDMSSKQSLVTLGNYVATIAHEVKNPLISIGGFAKRLMKAITNEDLKRMAGIIATESIRLEHLTEDILSFSGKRVPNKSKILLKDFFGEIKPLFEARIAEHNFKLDVDIPDDACIYADVNQIKQVVVNLITNAMNAMENDGTVSITFKKQDGKASIMISDSGPGIPLDVMPNLFKPFFTTSSSGTGLGLPISRKILNNHNGDLTVYNGKNGAVFTLTLPVE